MSEAVADRQPVDDPAPPCAGSRLRVRDRAAALPDPGERPRRGRRPRLLLPRVRQVRRRAGDRPGPRAARGRRRRVHRLPARPVGAPGRRGHRRRRSPAAVQRAARSPTWTTSRSCSGWSATRALVAGAILLILPLVGLGLGGSGVPAAPRDAADRRRHPDGRAARAGRAALAGRLQPGVRHVPRDGVQQRPLDARSTDRLPDHAVPRRLLARRDAADRDAERDRGGGVGAVGLGIAYFGVRR